MSGTDPGPEIVMAWIEASDCRIIDTWDTSGLRATGSHDIEVTDLFVPKHRTFPVPLPDPVPDGALLGFPHRRIVVRRDRGIGAWHRAGGDRRVASPSEN